MAFLQQRVQGPGVNQVNPFAVALLLGELVFELFLLLFEFLVQPGLVFVLLLLAGRPFLRNLRRDRQDDGKIVIGPLPDLEALSKVVEGLEG